MTDFYSQNRCVCSTRSHGPLLCAFCLSFHFNLHITSQVLLKVFVPLQMVEIMYMCSYIIIYVLCIIIYRYVQLLRGYNIDVGGEGGGGGGQRGGRAGVFL